MLTTIGAAGAQTRGVTELGPIAGDVVLPAQARGCDF